MAELWLVDPDNFTPYYNRSLTLHLSRLGWKVGWLSSRHEFEPGIPSRDTFFVGLKGRALPVPLRRLLKLLLYPWGWWSVYRQLGRRPPGILHVQWSLFPWLDGLMWSFWRRRGWKVCFTAHDVEAQAGTLPAIYSRAYPKLLQNADALLVHSHYGAGVLHRQGLGRLPIEVLPMGPNLPDLVGSLPTREQALRSLGLPDDRLILLQFGHIKPYKGLEVLLRSLPELVERHPKVLLVVAGQPSGPTAHYQRAIASGGLDAHVHWVPRFVAGVDVGAYFQAADLVVLPYLQSTSSAILVTALHLGKAVVASRVGGIPELIEHGKNGWLFEPGDARTLTNSLDILCQSTALRQQLGREAALRAAEHHTWERLAEGLDRLYRKLLVPAGEPWLPGKSAT